jgi:pyruvate,water dikinase
MTIRAAEGTREVPVPASQQRQAVLSDKQVTELARLGVRIEQFYAMPMDIEWALAGGRFAIVQARPITALPPEWNRSVPEALYARNSLAEHIPGPLTPLFATLGFEVANRVNYHSMEGFLGKQNAQEMIPDRAEYEIINHYLYRRDYIRAKVVLKILAMYIPQFVRLARESAALTQAARQELVAVVEEWEQQSIERFSPAQLLDGVRTILAAAIRYYNQIQVTLPISATSEVLFTKAYESLIRGAGDPEALSFLLGLDTVAQRAELSLFDIAAWMRANPPVANYVFQHTTDRLAAGLGEETPPEALPVELWNEWRQRLGRHLHDFGRTAYEFDFANPTPQETPGPVIDALKAYLAGRTEDPRRRQREARDRRERATDALLQRLGWLRRALFVKLLRWAQDTGPMREDSIFDMGMGHPLMRRLLAELGRRFVAGGALAQAGDIYWLEQNEVEGLIAELERGAALPNLAARIPDRRAQWQAALGMSPPLMLPERSGWMRFMHGGDAETKNGKVVLKGIGTSGGRVTASARVLFGPEDFGTLKPGDVLVAVTTTPAWTPLFAQAAAVVTDIGGPLSHSSIVAREYGIPAVMAARSATRAIHNGQLITVDGNAGTVTVEN